MTTAPPPAPSDPGTTRTALFESDDAGQARRLPLRAAWIGLARRPTLWSIIAAWLVQTIGFGVGLNYGFYTSLAADPATAEQAEELRQAMLLAHLDQFAAGSVPFFGVAMALVLGAIAIGSDHAYGTITLLMSAGPSRLAVWFSQTAALVGLLGIMTIATYLVDAAGLLVIGQLAGWPIGAPPPMAVLTSLLATWLTLAAYGLLGAMLATLARGPVVALAVGLVWCLAIETGLIMLGRVVPAISHLAPVLLAGASSNLAVARGTTVWWFNAPQTTATSADGWLAAGVLALWCLGAAVATAIVIRRRDV